MKRFSPRSAAALTALLAAVAASPAGAADHSNLDSGRPLRIEDARAIAYGEQNIEYGLAAAWPRRRPLGATLDVEYLNGIALNTHAVIGFEPRFGGRAGSPNTSPEIGSASLGLFHNFNRETRSMPALALRGDVLFPTSRQAKGTALRLRGIATRSVGQHGKLHLNVDLNANPGAASGAREINTAVTLGYSRPLGLPRRFDRTVVAEVGWAQGQGRRSGPLGTVGLGMRQQISPRSVLDVGLQSDVFGSRGAPRDRLRLIVGVSTAF